MSLQPGTTDAIIAIKVTMADVTVVDIEEFPAHPFAVSIYEVRPTKKTVKDRRSIKEAIGRNHLA